jgi:hypothetical protein
MPFTEVGLVQEKWPDPEGRILVVDLGLPAGATIPPYLRANIYLSPMGDPATETLFTVQKMAKRRSPTPPSGTASAARRWVRPAALALAVIGATLVLAQMLGRSGPQVVQAVNGIAAGQEIKVGGAVNINKGGADRPPWW